jgi:hypothetical protein
MDAKQQTATGEPAVEDGSKWIGIEERLPSIDEKVWVLFCKRNGEPRKLNPVKDADFVLSAVFGEESLQFCLEKHRNVYFPPEYCPKAGLTHWQPRIDDIPPSPNLDPAYVAPRPRKIIINVSPEERERRAERMRNYWRNRRGMEQEIG